MELVVDNIDQPGAEETCPTESQHNTDVVRGQIMVISVDILVVPIDILDLHSFFDIQYSMNG